MEPFEGRINRRTFIAGFVISIVALYAIVFIAEVIFVNADVGYFTFIPVVLSVLLLISISIRRLHDSGHSGYFTLLSLSGLGLLVLAVLWLKAGADGPNRYGDAPEKPFSVRKIFGLPPSTPPSLRA